MSEIDELRGRIQHLESIINEVHSWAVCAAIATPDDMAQNFPRIVEITQLDTMRQRTEYARGWNDCCDTFKIGCHIVPAPGHE
jgi:hypothetical protein